MSRTKQNANKSTGGNAPRDLLAMLALRQATSSMRILRGNGGCRTSQDPSAEVLFSDGEIYFRIARSNLLMSRLRDLCGRADVEKLTKSRNGNLLLPFSSGEGVERSSYELERVFGKHIVQSAMEGGKTMDTALISRIGLSESVTDEKDYGPLDDDLDWTISHVWLPKRVLRNLLCALRDQSKMRLLTQYSSTPWSRIS